MKKIGITIGDINGIGPEVTLKAINEYHWDKNIKFYIFGSKSVFIEQAEYMKLSLSEKIEFIDIAYDLDEKWNPGILSNGAAILAAESIKYGVESCLRKDIDAIVTAPITKAGFNNAGINYPGHTEMLASLTKTDYVGMMLIGGGLRVMLVTRHIPLSKVPFVINKNLIKKSIKITHDGLIWLGMKNPKIGVCGLNPHAGDQGMLGDEEILIINPAISSIKEIGINVDEAAAADTIFHHALKGKYDAVIAMYHDQGLAPLKTQGFDDGVNLTLGLPIIRTSPDHGTAFAIAGKNKASSNSMKNAIKLAIDLSEKRNPWT